jgi:hypothetical protein
MTAIETIQYQPRVTNFKQRLVKLVRDKNFWKKFALWAGISTAALAVLGVILYFFYSPKMEELNHQVKATVAQAKKVNTAINDQNVLVVQEELTNLKKEVSKTEERLRPFVPIKFIPWLGSYYSDAEHALKAGESAIDAGLIITESLIPFADTLGLKGVASEDTAQSKVNKIVRIIPKIMPKLDEIETKLKIVRSEVDHINPNRYPEEFQGYKIRSLLAEAKKGVDYVGSYMPEIRQVLAVLPSALGEPDPKTYFILFQNDKELRATGGFLTSYAIARVAQGQLTDVKSDDIYNLEKDIVADFPTPQAIKDYLKMDDYNLRDSNLSPDFLISMKEVEKFYDKASSRQDIDGIIALDTEFVRSLLEVTGPVTTKKYKETFSAEISEEGMPDVVYKLELYAENKLWGTLNEFGKEARKEIIGDLMDAMLSNILNSPQEKWQPLLNLILEQAQEKHILAYVHDSQTQEVLEKYNLAGRIKDYDGDYLHVNNSNFAGRKSNLYITEKIDQDIEIGSDGTVTKKVTVTLKNPKPVDGWLNANYFGWMRFFVPKGSSLISSEASWKEVFSGEDLNKSVYYTHMRVIALGTGSMTATYKLPFKIQKGQDYKLLMQKQPGTSGPEVVIRINGKEKERFFLTTDREVRVKY